jgi:hypothetical protein
MNQTYMQMNENVSGKTRNEMNGRRSYLMRLFGIFIFLPTCAEVLGNAIGFDFGTFSTIIKVDSNGNTIATGFRMEFLSVWYLSLPLFFYYTYKRVTDTSLNPWFTILFILPVINLVIWFWPHKKNES